MTNEKQGEVRLRTKFGEYRWFQALGKVVSTDSNGGSCRVVGTITDVTERKRATAALEASQRELLLVANHVPGPVSRVDRNLRYLFANDHYESYLGLSRGDVIGKRISDVLGPELFQTAEPYAKRALAGEHVTYESSLSFGTHDGRHGLVHYVPDFDEHKHVVGFFIIAIDITERKRAETTLRSRERELRRITDKITGPVARVDRGLRYLVANEYYEKNRGFS